MQILLIFLDQGLPVGLQFTGNCLEGIVFLGRGGGTELPGCKLGIASNLLDSGMDIIAHKKNYPSQCVFLSKAYFVFLFFESGTVEIGFSNLS